MFQTQDGQGRPAPPSPGSPLDLVKASLDRMFSYRPGRHDWVVRCRRCSWGIFVSYPVPGIERDPANDALIMGHYQYHAQGRHVPY